MPTIDFVFKILTPKEWNQFQKEGVFGGSALDQKDGFIHAALANQHPRILQKFFKAQRPLVLLRIDSNQLAAGTLKLESNKPGGEQYPHIYGEILLAAVVSHEDLD